MGAIDIARSVAGFSGRSPVPTALVAVAITGNCITIILTLALVYMFIKSVCMEGSVGDRRVYENLIMFFNSLMWALYTSNSLPYKPFFFIASGVGFVAQIICIFIYIYFAKGKKHTQAILLFFAFTAIALIIAVVVAFLVVTHRWSSTFIDVIALVSGASMHIVTLFDLVMKRKEIKNMNPITTFISLLGASTWTAYGFMSVHVNPYVVRIIAPTADPYLGAGKITIKEALTRHDSQETSQGFTALVVSTHSGAKIRAVWVWLGVVLFAYEAKAHVGFASASFTIFFLSLLILFLLQVPNLLGILSAVWHLAMYLIYHMTGRNSIQTDDAVDRSSELEVVSTASSPV